MSAKTKRKPRGKAAATRRAKTKPAKKRSPSSKKPETVVAEVPAGPETKAAPLAVKSFVFALRLSGPVTVPIDMQKALHVLKMDKKFNAVLLENSSSTLGMLRRVKDYITWGGFQASDISNLLRNRAYVTGNAHLTDQFVKDNFGEESVDGLASALTQGRIQLKALWQHGVKPVFRLHAPSGGFQYSTKRPFGSHGELGNRGQEIRSLLSRMF